MGSPSSFRQIFDEVERRRRVVTVFSATDTEWLDSLLGSSHVTVERRSISPGEVRPFLTVRAGDEYLGSVRLDDLELLVTPEIQALGRVEAVEAAGRHLRRMLSDTVFSSMDRRQLLASSREIEDRAWRVGRGEIHAGFQSLSALEAQSGVYASLARRPSLAVHVYGSADGDPDRELSDVIVHPTRAEDVVHHWFVVYDGGGDEFQKCAVLAEQVDDRTYRGFWTYDPAIVDDMLARLDQLSEDGP